MVFNFHFENRRNPLLPFRAFLSRQLVFILGGSLILGFSLGIGMIGYHSLAGLSWIDSFYNACMILTGMGPTSTMPSDLAKVFSGCYALFSGVLFLTTVAVMLAPVAHRLLHRLHIEPETRTGHRRTDGVDQAG